MKKTNGIVCKIFIAVFLFICLFKQPDIAHGAQLPGSKIDLQKTQVLVKFRDESKADSTKKAIKTKLKLSKFELKRTMKRSKVELLEIDGKDDMKNLIKNLKSDPNVEYAQPNYKLQTLDVDPKDPRFNEQWGLSNVGQTIQSQAGKTGVDIDALKAWNITNGAGTVLIGVLDTGIDISHEDLKNNIYVKSGEIKDNGKDDDGNGYIDDVNGWNFVSDNNQVYSSSDEDKHGTHVAGIIAASANQIGVSGVAPSVKILPLKFMSGNEGYTSDAIEAIDYAAQMGVKIMNCSFGSTDYNYALRNAIAQSGMIFVCAGGNTSADSVNTHVYPADFNLPNIISVAAVDNIGKLASFSAYGKSIDVAAPGVNILSTTPGNNYEFLSGTSIATPFVTGIAALIESKYPDITNTSVVNRIRQGVNKSGELKNKVITGGVIDAYNSLTLTEDPNAVYSKPNDIPKEDQTASKTLSVQAANVSPELIEQLHYGENGVSAASGNYSKNVTDISVNSPGFLFNINRVYNSKDDRTSSSMGRGWTFGYEGSIREDYSYSIPMEIAKLPNSSTETFVRNLDGVTYTACDSRSTLAKNPDGTYAITTKDQHVYGFNVNGYLSYIKDRNGNTIIIQVDSSGKVNSIIDSAGRQYNIGYNSFNLIATITDPINRVVRFDYTNNLLTQVTDPAGNTIGYGYDNYNYLSSVKDNNGNVIESIVYSHDPYSGNNQNRVVTYTDAYGNIYNYQYDTANRVTTITDSKNRQTMKWYDSYLYLTKTQDPENKVTSVTYYLDNNGLNKFGEEKFITDRNGNETQYVRDGVGNILKTTNPDLSSKTYTYDEKNNLLSETDEAGKSIYYIYDSLKINVIKKAQPLNGTDVYTPGCDESRFAVTNYEYYTDSEAQGLGYKAKGLLKSVTDPEGNPTSYTYDENGNVKTIKDSENHITTNSYNRLGWKMETISPKGYKVDYVYDNDGRLEKTILNNGETTRVTYDGMGRVTKTVSPNQYTASDDGLNDTPFSHTYRGDVGIRNVYNTSPGLGYGKIQYTLDAEGNKTSYTYDIYGNVETELKPNGALYRYTYDVMNKLAVVYFKDSSAPEMLYEEYAYTTLPDKNTQVTYTKHFNGTEKAVTVYKYDYDNRLINKVNPDGTNTSTAYNTNGTVNNTIDERGNTTYYQYDGFNRLTDKWSPIEVNLYMYSGISYDKLGRMTASKAGKDKVAKLTIPTSDRLIVKYYTYYRNGLLKTVSVGANKVNEYKYDDDGNISEQDTYTNGSTKEVTTYDNNQLGKPLTITKHVNSGDIYGNAIDNTQDMPLVTTNVYDKNGNVTSTTTPDNVTTTYTYDNMNRVNSISKPGKDEYGNSVVLHTSTQYDWEGKPLVTTNSTVGATETIINKITNTYNQRGLLITSYTLDNTNGKHYTNAYYYDLGGRKIAEVDPKYYDSSKQLSDMNRTEYDYDSMDRLLTKTEVYKPDSTATSFTRTVTAAYAYDNDGNVIKKQDAVGYTSNYGEEYTYNFANEVVTVLDPVSKDRNLSYTVKYDYDGLGRKVAETDANGVVTRFYYDDFNKITSTTVAKTQGAAEKVVASFTYDYLGDVKTKTDGNGNLTTYEYNSFNKVKKVIYPGDTSISGYNEGYQYDVMGNLLYKLTSTGKVNLYTYDNNGRMLSNTEKDIIGNGSITKSVKYDVMGNKRFETDGNGVTTENKYDGIGRLIESDLDVTNLNNVKTSKAVKYTYDDNNNLLTSTDVWRGITSSFEYDALNKVVKKIVDGKVIKMLEYYPNGLQSKDYEAPNDGSQKFNAKQFVYDKNNRIIQTIDPLNHTVTQTYDNVGNISTKADGKNNTTTYKYDEFNRLSTVINAKNETTGYTYDNNGNMLTQTDGKGNVTNYQYNCDDKISKKIASGGISGTPGNYVYNTKKTESFTYYANGELNTQIDRNGNTTSYIYDIHGRLTSQVTTDGAITYTYDGNGNRLSMTDSTGTTTYTYDEQDRLKTKTLPTLGTMTYLYDILLTGDDAGCVKEVMTDVKGNITSKTYDRFDRLKYVNADNSPSSTVYEYYDNGSRKKVTNPNGTTSEYTYNANDLVKTLINKELDGTLIDSYSYAYDAANNQISKVDNKGTDITNFTYDALNRLSSVSEADNKVTSYTFDAAGNRLTETVNQNGKPVVTNYNYDDQNRLLKTVKSSENNVVETTKYSYDNNGNVIAKLTEHAKPSSGYGSDPAYGLVVIGKSNNKLTETDIVINRYTASNELVKSITGNQTLTYSYDGDGLRVSKKVDGKTTKYVYDDLDAKVILELDGQNLQTARNVQGTNLISRTADGQTAYYMYNGHGDVTALMSTTGSAIGTYYYDAFGNLEINTSTFNNPYLYAGYMYDSETGDYYLNARYYDPTIARFISEDTYTGDTRDPLSLNLYTYCSNEPIMYTDPNGHYQTEDDGTPVNPTPPPTPPDPTPYVPDPVPPGPPIIQDPIPPPPPPKPDPIPPQPPIVQNPIPTPPTPSDSGDNGYHYDPRAAALAQWLSQFANATINLAYLIDYSANANTQPWSSGGGNFIGDGLGIDIFGSDNYDYFQKPKTNGSNTNSSLANIKISLGGSATSTSSKNEKINQILDQMSYIYAEYHKPINEVWDRKDVTEELDPYKLGVEAYLNKDKKDLSKIDFSKFSQQDFLYFQQGYNNGAGVRTGITMSTTDAMVMGTIAVTGALKVKPGAKVGTAEAEWNSFIPKGGATIGGREYSEHALERMAPDTAEVRAELTTKATKLAREKGLQPQTKEYNEFINKYVDPRDITPTVIEDAINNTKALPGNTEGTFVHENANVKVIVNQNGKVVTVIPR